MLEHVVTMPKHQVVLMSTKKVNSYVKIAGCASVYVVFVIIVFGINIQNNTVLVLLSTLVGSVVVVASYHEYRGTLVRLPAAGKNKGKLKASFIEPTPDLVIPANTIACVPQQENNQVKKIDDGIPAFDLAMFSPEVLKKVSGLHVDDEIQDEIFNAIKEIPPEQRLKYIDSIFQANHDFEAAY
jgi:hypothetical protein